MPIVKGFRRFQSNIVFFRQVVTENEISSGSKSGCGFTSKSKRITIADRRELLESFVNKYRAMNSGKFPSPTSAQKEVGGGYYSIKKMLQEMEYNSRLSSVEKLPVTKEEIKKQNKSEDTVNREIASRSQQASNLYEIESVGNLDKNSKGKEGLQPSTSKNITRDGTHEQVENHAKDEDDKFGFEGIGSKVEQQHEHDGIRNIAREMSESQKDEELREKASSISIWGNLKSLASGFINIWKKQ